MTRQEQVNELVVKWSSDDRWEGIERTYRAEDVVNLRGSVRIEHTLAKLGAKKFWNMLNNGETVCALGAVTCICKPWMEIKVPCGIVSKRTGRVFQ